MGDFFRDMVNLAEKQEAKVEKIFEANVNKYISKIDTKIRKKIRKNALNRKIQVRESFNEAKQRAINIVCNKLEQEGFSVTKWQYPYEVLAYRIISW